MILERDGGEKKGRSNNDNKREREILLRKREIGKDRTSKTEGDRNNSKEWRRYDDE